MHSFKRIMNNIKNNKGGFSLIEIMVVVFIMVALTTVSIGSFTAYYRARSSKVSKTIDTMIAQSKIDALSGKENFLMLRKADKDFFVELYSVNGKHAACYKQEPAGNNWVTITYEADGSVTEISDTNFLIIKFNQRSGAVDYMSAVTSSVFNPDNTEGENYTEFEKVTIPKMVKIQIESTQNYTIELYSASGEHQIV
jgi:prepilin-type N-terminal cleavage/methylation domain-containing protein